VLPSAPAVVPEASLNLWDRLKHHKVMQWTLAYAAAAYTLLHGVEMLSEAQEWPHVIVRIFSLLLILGVPMVATLAWYHGAKGLKRISGGELMIITMLGIIAGSALWALARRSSEHPATPTSAAIATAPAAASNATTAPRTAVAVLPFANLTGDASKEYLGDGMAEELINTLTKVQGLKVPARTSTFAYKGRNTDIRQIAKDLGVGTILEGSVRAAGKRIRITAQLINAQDGLHMWSETYDRDFTDVFKLQDDLAGAIARALQPNLTDGQKLGLAPARPTQDVEAYRLYLLGTSLSSRLGDESLLRAKDYFRQAIARDPKFARAYAGLALAELMRSNARPAEYVQNARQAIALDSSVATAHSVLAWSAAIKGFWLEEESEFGAALAADPNDGETRAHYAEQLVKVGHVGKALREAEQANAAAPANPMVAVTLAGIYAAIERDAEAVRYADQAAELGITRDQLGWIYASATRRAGHLSRAAAGKPPGPDDVHTQRIVEVTRLVYAALAEPARKPAAISSVDRWYPRRDAPAIGTVFQATLCAAGAQQYALLDALDAAYDVANRCLNDMTAAGLRMMGYLPAAFWSLEMRAFRRDSRFQALATRLGLMEYWQQYGPPDECDLNDGKLTCQ
jgi:TolB-like protein/Tfp pilus assembly protein PilF